MRDLVRKKGTNKDVAPPLGITPQALGKYMKGRTIPLHVVTKWKKAYGDDLLELSKDIHEPNVSRETKDDKPINQPLNDIPTSTLHLILLESIKGINKLVDQNSGLIEGKNKEVDRLDRVNDRLLSQLENLTSKLRVTKEAE